MDVVYLVRPGETNEELRFSLRTLCEHYPHERVVIIGYKPSWVRGVEHLPVKADKGPRSKYPNVMRALRVLGDTSRLTKRVILMNDDFFFLRDLDQVPRLNRGALKPFVEEYFKTRSSYGYGAVETEAIIRKFRRRPLCYELHAPMIIDRAKHRAAMLLMDRYGAHPKVPHHRSLYGNFVKYGGEEVRDYKLYGVRSEVDLTRRFASTSDYVFRYGRAGEQIRERYTEASPYEQ